MATSLCFPPQASHRRALHSAIGTACLLGLWCPPAEALHGCRVLMRPQADTEAPRPPCMGSLGHCQFSFSYGFLPSAAQQDTIQLQESHLRVE